MNASITSFSTLIYLLFTCRTFIGKCILLINWANKYAIILNWQRSVVCSLKTKYELALCILNRFSQKFSLRNWTTWMKLFVIILIDILSLKAIIFSIILLMKPMSAQGLWNWMKNEAKLNWGEAKNKFLPVLLSAPNYTCIINQNLVKLRFSTF